MTNQEQMSLLRPLVEKAIIEKIEHAFEKGHVKIRVIDQKQIRVILPQYCITAIILNEH